MAAMKLILSGYEGSKKILAASSYFISKYIGTTFDTYFLNYGKYDRALYCGRYIELDTEQIGGSASWGKYVADYLSTLDDEFIVFGLDDYFINTAIDEHYYKELFNRMRHDDTVVCARLCDSNFYLLNEYELVPGYDWLISLTEGAEYSVTTQYCIWRRAYLIELLRRFTTPWQFEIDGSKFLNRSRLKVIGSQVTPLKYQVSSALSPRWGTKIKVGENKPDDIKYLVNSGHLNMAEVLHE
jgi:hypothetical protein